ncbi:MAG: M48 family metallopeptidase [Campylobacterales bacterium]|nr:M48 family metallopeptidase [Campylobacterales bacterium]
MDSSIYLVLGVYALYGLTKVYISVMNFGFILEKRSTTPVLLDNSKWVEAANYEMAKEKFSIVSSFFDLFLFFFWLGFGLDYLSTLVANQTNSILQSVIFIDLFVIVGYVLTLPFGLYEKFVIDKKFGFNNSTLKLFIADEIKGGVIGLVLTSVVVAGVAWFLESSENWWIYTFIFLFSVIILINMLFPTIRALMFDKFTPMDETPLGVEIGKLLEREGFKISGIFKVDASKRDSRLNAYFGGLGKTKRVVLYDTLIEKLTTNELLAVLGHELGHFKHKDILKNIAIMGGLLLFILALFGNIPTYIYEDLGLYPSTHILIALFMIFSTPIFFFAMPLINILSRENEFAADEFGGEVQTTQDMGSALIKLSNENKKFPLSHILHKIFYETHPGVIERLEKMGVPYNKPNNEEIDIVKMAEDG